MERFLKLWVESSKEPQPFEEVESAKNVTYPSPMFHSFLSRPPPLRTSSTYDDDDAFNVVALNLLSRHDTLGLSATEAILATLIDANQRASFNHGLCNRLDRSAHLSPSTASLVHHLNKALGKELKELIVAECKIDPCYTNKPTTPRGVGYCRSMKQKMHRCFFPDRDKGVITSPIRSNNSVLFGSKRRVQNIDWKMAEAIQQVNHLCLDGSQFVSPSKADGYEPPRGL